MTDGLKRIFNAKANFKHMIEGNFLYVDKTEYYLKMIESGSTYFFLSRPRRFGKTLTVRTLEHLFLAEKDLFKDLYIYDKYDFESFPVIHLNMSSVRGTDLGQIKLCLEDMVRDAAREVHVTLRKNVHYPDVLFADILKGVLRDGGKPAVVLIDEYDFPLLENVRSKDFELVRQLLADFYTPLKTYEDSIHFCFITGVTRFSQVSIFSKLNNLVDLSDDPDYAAICGYTDEELDKYFTPYFENYFEKNGVASDEEKKAFRSSVREYYDGYRFTLDSDVTLYNPVSIGKFVNAKCRKFDNYWIGTGAQSLVIELVQRHVHLFNQEEKFIINNVDSMKTFEARKFFFGNPTRDSIYSFMKQAGYLSLEGMEERKVVLRYPNVEVASTMVATVLEAMGLEGASRLTVQAATAALVKGDTETLISCISDLLALYPYDLTLEKEKGFQIVIYSLFVHILKEVRVEEHTATGRMDILVKVGDGFYYILELKVDKSANVALSQIEKMEYYRALKQSGNKIHLVGINFSSKKRDIQGWDEKVISF